MSALVGTGLLEVQQPGPQKDRGEVIRAASMGMIVVILAYFELILQAELRSVLKSHSYCFACSVPIRTIAVHRPTGCS